MVKCVYIQTRLSDKSELFLRYNSCELVNVFNVLLIAIFQDCQVRFTVIRRFQIIVNLQIPKSRADFLHVFCAKIGQIEFLLNTREPSFPKFAISARVKYEN